MKINGFIEDNRVLMEDPFRTVGGIIDLFENLEKEGKTTKFMAWQFFITKFYKKSRKYMIYTIFRKSIFIKDIPKIGLTEGGYVQK